MKNQKINDKIVEAPFVGIPKRHDTTVPNKYKKQSGITLIALVITIIILLILAGITINLTLGEHGIIKMAEKAGKNYVNAAEDEQKKLGELLNEVDNIINGTGNNSNPITPPSPPSAEVGGTTHTPHKIDYTWEELEELAKMISDNYGTTEEGKVNNDTAEVNVSINGKSETLGIGDYTTVNGKQVRILGFNHDILTNQEAYGEGETNTYAGISFEFAECLTTAAMNNIDTTEGGWGACDLRSTLNNTTISSFENKLYIKEVKKQYIATYNDASSVTTSNDKLWLLSCSEIWNNGRDGQPYGVAVAKEGEQYKYYIEINTNSNNSDDAKLVKKNNSSPINWWLRSPVYFGDNFYCNVHLSGSLQRWKC